LRFGGEECVEDLVSLFSGESKPSVANGDQQLTIIGPLRVYL
jgi:hypothetical protein